MDLIIIGAVTCLVCAIFAGIIGARKQSGCLGFFLGLFLGPIGVLIAALLPSRAEPAPRQPRTDRRQIARPMIRIKRREPPQP